MEMRDLFLAQHSAIHTVAVGGNKASAAAARVLNGLTEDQMRLRPREDLNSIAWILWHVARAEDIIINPVLTGRDQLFDDAWMKRLGVTRKDFGVGMKSPEVTDLTRSINLDALREYRDAVGKRTRELIGGFQPQDWEGQVQQSAMERAAAEGAVPPPMVQAFSGPAARGGVLSGIALFHPRGAFWRGHHHSQRRRLRHRHLGAGLARRVSGGPVCARSPAMTDASALLNETRRELARFSRLLELLVGEAGRDLPGRPGRARRVGPVEIVCHLRDEETEDFGARLRKSSSGGRDLRPTTRSGWRSIGSTGRRIRRRPWRPFGRGARPASICSDPWRPIACSEPPSGPAVGASPASTSWRAGSPTTASTCNSSRGPSRAGGPIDGRRSRSTMPDRFRTDAARPDGASRDKSDGPVIGGARSERRRGHRPRRTLDFALRGCDGGARAGHRGVGGEELRAGAVGRKREDAFERDEPLTSRERRACSRSPRDAFASASRTPGDRASRPALFAPSARGGREDLARPGEAEEASGGNRKTCRHSTLRSPS